LISPNLKIRVFSKDNRHQSVNNLLALIYKNLIISSIWPRILTADPTIEHKQKLKDVALRTVRYSWRSSTAVKTLLFTQSVNSTNITVHILKCVTVMNQDTLLGM